MLIINILGFWNLNQNVQEDLNNRYFIFLKSQLWSVWLVKIFHETANLCHTETLILDQMNSWFKYIILSSHFN